MLVVEDHGPTRQAIRVVLEHAGFEAEVAAGGHQALECFRSRAPEVALVDLGLPDMDGIELIRLLVAESPGLPVLVLSGATSPERILSAVRAGATGYLFKEELGSRLALAVAELLAGGAPMSAAAARHVLAALAGEMRRPTPAPGTVRVLATHPGSSPSALGEHNPAAPGRLGSGSFLLTERERLTLGLLARGLRYQEVAELEGLSINTVRSHVRSIYKKLDVSTRAEAIMVAHDGGLFR